MFLMVIRNEEDCSKVAHLYKQYRYLMYSIAYNILHDKYLAEDAVQQSFIRIIHNLHKINEVVCPKTQSFLAIICRNVSIDIYNKRVYLNKTDSTDNIAQDKDNTVGEEPSEIVINKESVNRIVAAIISLKPIYRDVMLLRYSHEYSSLEIAELLNLPPETVRKRLTRAKNKLFTALGRELSK